MAITNTLLGGTDWSNGDVLTHTALNDTFNAVAKGVLFQQIYTSTGFDSTKAVAGNDEDDHELTAITAATLVGMNYLIIDILGTGAVDPTDASGANKVEVKIQTKETGGAYADSMAYVAFLSLGTISTDGLISTHSLRYVHTLTAGEKTAGVQVKLFSKSTVVAAGTASFTNIQVLEGVSP